MDGGKVGRRLGREGREEGGKNERGREEEERKVAWGMMKRRREGG